MAEATACQVRDKLALPTSPLIVPSVAHRLQGRLPAHWHDAVLIGSGLLLTAAVGLADFVTGPRLSFELFYLIPVTVCAWWGGVTPGILLAVCAAFVRGMIETTESPQPSFAEMWNGIVNFGTLVLAASLVARLHGAVRSERRLARTDSLTGAANGRTFYEMAAAEAARADRFDRPLTLAYMDLDGFKLLNDRMGHAAGDKALQQLVLAIQSMLRASDLLARVGGDEFALLLPETNFDGASAILARLQLAVAHEMERGGWPVTLSIGAVTYLHAPREVDLMVRRVDALMYAAKATGKGRIEHAVLQNAEDTDLEQGRWPERRATARILCNQTAKVRCEGEADVDEGFATVRDLSIGGLSLCLDKELPENTLLVVESLQPGAPALLARVLRAKREGNAWRHGCELSARLNAAELQYWLGDPQEMTA